jgi:hypothetical protein
MTPEWMTNLTATVPSLATTPTAPAASGVSFQPPGVFSGQQQTSSHPSELMGQGGAAFDMDFVYSTSRGKLVPVVNNSPGRRSSTVRHQVTAKPSLAKNSGVVGVG